MVGMRKRGIHTNNEQKQEKLNEQEKRNQAGRNQASSRSSVRKKIILEEARRCSEKENGRSSTAEGEAFMEERRSYRWTPQQS